MNQRQRRQSWASASAHGSIVDHEAVTFGVAPTSVENKTLPLFPSDCAATFFEVADPASFKATIFAFISLALESERDCTRASNGGEPGL